MFGFQYQKGHCVFAFIKSEYKKDLVQCDVGDSQ